MASNAPMDMGKWKGECWAVAAIAATAAAASALACATPMHACAAAACCPAGLFEWSMKYQEQGADGSVQQLTPERQKW